MSDLDRKTDWQLDRPAWTELTGLDLDVVMELGQDELCKQRQIYPEFCSFLSFSIFVVVFCAVSSLLPFVPLRSQCVCLCVCLSCVLFAGHWPSRGNNFYAVALVKLAWQSPQGGEWEWRMRTLWMLKDAADAGVARGLGQNKVKCI